VVTVELLRTMLTTVVAAAVKVFCFCVSVRALKYKEGGYSQSNLQ
jgi:hypothetical protein